MALDERKGVWKSGKGRGRRVPKGRQVEDAALAEVRRLLGDRPRRRDLLIEHLHLIQDAHGHLSAAHLRALADEMRLAQAEVYEVATFYAHFDVVKEDETPPPALTVRVCDSLSCELAGAQALLAALRARHRPGGGAGGARAVHGALRHRAGGRGRAFPRGRRDAGGGRRGGGGGADARRDPALRGVRGVRGWGRLRGARGAACRGEDAGRGAGGGARRGAARARGRGLSDGAEVGVRAGGAGAAVPGGERRRGGAGDLQGPLVPGAHAAPDARGHADRRLGGRGGALLRLHARRVPGGAGDPAAGDRGAGGGGDRGSRGSWSSGAGRGRISAAKSRR